jgi:leader peptidase (prepilin peptidase)/N-methyltransferase
MYIGVSVFLGALFGSFMNVVIYRLPRGLNLVSGRSKCPNCDHQVAAYDNIPVFSWLILRGKCRQCSWKIPARYPIVESLSAAAAGIAVWVYGFTLEAAWIYLFLSLMLIITLIDWDHQIIPDPLSIGGVVLGWIGAIVCLEIDIVQSIIGSLVGAGVILAIAIVYRVVRKIHGMGGGDVKLMAFIGAFLGWQMIFPVLFIAAFFGSIYGIILMRGKSNDGKTAVAFGSFLAPAAVIMLFFGQQILTWYLSYIRPA